jgi:hypothetical protein
MKLDILALKVMNNYFLNKSSGPDEIESDCIVHGFLS